MTNTLEHLLQRSMRALLAGPHHHMGTRPERHICAPCEPHILPDMGGLGCARDSRSISPRLGANGHRDGESQHPDQYEDGE